jgi:hypothetical protein
MDSNESLPSSSIATITGGIKPSQIENYDNYESIFKDMICCICLEIVCKPLECIMCQTLICEDCYFILQQAGKNCVSSKCKGNFRKANKFVREILSNLKISCSWCNKGGLIYPDYISHLDKCEPHLLSDRVKILKLIKEKEDKAIELQKEITITKTANILNSSMVKKDPYAHLSNESLRTTLITFNLAVKNKMELYNSCVEGRTEDFKNCVLVKKYPILEEVSAHNYYWTSFHYSMHYGQWEIIKFITEQLKMTSKFDAAMRLESNDGRCPILCLLRSNSVDHNKKVDILNKFLSINPNLNFTPEAKKEIKLRNLESIVKKYHKNF